MTGFSTSLARDLNIFHRALSNPVRLKRLKFRIHGCESLLAKFRGLTQTDFWTTHPYLVQISVWLMSRDRMVCKDSTAHEMDEFLEIWIFQSSIPFQYSIKIKCEFHPEACKERFNCSKSISKFEIQPEMNLKCRN